LTNTATAEFCIIPVTSSPIELGRQGSSRLSGFSLPLLSRRTKLRRIDTPRIILAKDFGSAAPAAM
jgi:hypothetical protein